MQSSADRVWGTVQEMLRTMLSPETYDLWFGGIRARALDGQGLVLEVADEFCEVWLEKNYSDLIREKLLLVCGQPIAVKFVTGAAPASGGGAAAEAVAEA